MRTLPKRLLTLSLALGLTATAAVPAIAAATPAPYQVKVMVFTLFPPETSPWQKNEPLTQTFNVPGAASPVWCTTDGLCVTTTDMGKVNASLSAAAIVADPQFDLSHAVFLSSGIAGTPPQVGTLGAAAWGNWIVDWDLGHHVLPENGAASTPNNLFIPRPANNTDAFKLNQNLVTLAYNVTKETPLLDSEKAQAYRALYPGQAGRTPTVMQCDNVTGDDYWHGADLSATATSILSLRSHGAGTYCSTAMEDTGIAAALSRAGLLNRYVELRTMSNFDQPHPGQTVAESLNTSSGGFPLATENQYRVGAAFAHYVMAHENEIADAANLDLESNIHVKIGDAFVGTKLVNVNGHTLIPATDLAAALGTQITWNNQTRSVEISGKNGQIIVLPVDRIAATVNGQNTVPDAGAQIHNGHALVPLRFVAEALGSDVKWDGANQLITVVIK